MGILVEHRHSDFLNYPTELKEGDIILWNITKGYFKVSRGPETISGSEQLGFGSVKGKTCDDKRYIHDNKNIFLGKRKRLPNTQIRFEKIEEITQLMVVFCGLLARPVKIANEANFIFKSCNEEFVRFEIFRPGKSK